MLKIKFIDYDHQDDEDEGVRYLYIETSKSALSGLDSKEINIDDLEITVSDWSANGFCTAKIGNFNALDSYSFTGEQHKRDVESRER